jgi:hypothetical protein
VTVDARCGYAVDVTQMDALVDLLVAPVVLSEVMLVSRLMMGESTLADQRSECCCPVNNFFPLSFSKASFDLLIRNRPSRVYGFKNLLTTESKSEPALDY